jgi:hypothetical protein
METQTIAEIRHQLRRGYLRTQTPVPGYLREEEHICDPESYQLDPENCPACRALLEEKIRQGEIGKYR